MPLLVNPAMRGIVRTAWKQVARGGAVRLDMNEMDPPVDAGLFAEFLARLVPHDFSAYPSTAALVDRLAAREGVAPEQVHVGPGSDGVIATAFAVFGIPGLKVAQLEPSFGMYPVYCRMHGLTPAFVPFDAGLRIDEDALLRAVDERTCFVALANPNSPTGTMLPRETLARLVRRAAEFGVVVMVDEAYYPYSSYTAAPLIAEYPNVLVTRSFSKYFGAAGMRVGYAISSPEAIDWLKRATDSFEVCGLSVAAAHFCLDREDFFRARMLENRRGAKIIADCCRAHGAKVLDAGEAVFLNIRFGDRCDAALAALERADVRVKDMRGVPCLAGCLRISYTTPEVARRIAAAIAAACPPPSP
ncbi:MAG: histidinol-phosphate aminotransferase family protein [Planctomycetes bacterium]|nr:histidinol-phosphate aminotransferase family protein [Planctomycetota bacterium]